MFTEYPVSRPAYAVIRDFHCAGWDDTPIDSAYEAEGIENGWLTLITWYRDVDNTFVRVYVL